MQRRLRDTLGRFVTGVTVVTTRAGDGRPLGLTVSSFNSLSLEPPLVLWSLSDRSSCLAGFCESDRFAVHVLSAEQEWLARRFASQVPDRFHAVPLEPDPVEAHGPPLLLDCTARFQCRTVARHRGGDHLLFVGEVEQFQMEERIPLICYAGGFGRPGVAQ